MVQNNEASDLRSRVEKAIDSIRPYLISDGGDVRIVGIRGTVLEVELLGACSTCPISATTMKGGIEEVVKRNVPEITAILAVETSEQELS